MLYLRGTYMFLGKRFNVLYFIPKHTTIKSEMSKECDLQESKFSVYNEIDRNPISIRSIMSE